MHPFIIVGFIILGPSFATAFNVSPVTPVTSALAARQTFRVQATDEKPRFQPNRLIVNTGDVIKFEIQSPSCELWASETLCESLKPTPLEGKEFVVTSARSYIFFCGPVHTSSCATDTLSILNTQHLPSQGFNQYGSTKIGPSSGVLSPSPTGTGSLRHSAPFSSSAKPGLSTRMSLPRIKPTSTKSSVQFWSSSKPVSSSYIVSPSPIRTSSVMGSDRFQLSTSQLFRSSEIPTSMLTASGKVAGTTSTYPTATPSSQETNFRSAAGTTQMKRTTMANVFLGISYVFYMLR